jgi:hypothetical protein
MSDRLPFSLDPNLEIGTVFEVTGTSIKVALQRGLDELTRLYRGQVHTVGEIGSLVRIRFGRKLLFASVRGLRLQTEEEAAALSAAIEAERRVLEADLIGEGFWDAGASRLDFHRGLTGSALPMQKVYLLTADEMHLVYQALEKSRGESATFVQIGEYVGAAHIPVRADIDRMFGHHCAILGSTGAGKSSAVAAILRSVLEAEPNSDGRRMMPRIVLIDPHGEYGRAFAKEAVVYRAYDALGHEGGAGEQLRLPYWLMSSDEFRSLIVGKGEFEATSQANTVYKALAHARMVASGFVEAAQEDISNTPAGRHPQDPILKPGTSEEVIGSFDRDKPVKFSLGEFERHIRLRQPYKYGKPERVPAGEFHKDYGSILDKLAVLKNDKRIQFLMKDCDDTDPSLAEILAQFVGARPDGRNLRIVDISGLPNEVAGPLTAAIARLLFQYKLHQTPDERCGDPILLICEEAHRYVPDRGEAQYSAAQAAVRRIAREGRKYGLGLMLVSQRPSDVEGTVISQCGTWIVLRLTNGSDQAHVSRFLPDSLTSLVSLLPTLPRREALFVGEGSALPARIRIRKLAEMERPRSDDVAFGIGWRTNLASEGDLQKVACRMNGTLQDKTAA